MVDTQSTIFAVASPPGRSVRGIIRISGEGTFDLLRAICSDNSLDPIQRGTRRLRLSTGSQSLPALALLMPGPHSYTGEDSAELQLPGNPILLERILSELLVAAKSHNIDARLANPGEFTARAFFSGRITLTQAEGVAATIAAQSDAQLRAASLLRTGGLGSLASQWADDLAGALALVEAGIDFTDQEDVVAIEPSDLHERLLTLRNAIDAQLERAVGMEQLEAIPWVVLRGAPNAGKSTLFNALLGRERAVVSDIAGTTRDVITEPLHVRTDHGDAEVMLVDLAGFDEQDQSTINQMMQRAARNAVDRAELILHCIPVNERVDTPVAAGEILVRTKSDRTANPHAKSQEPEAKSIFISAITGEGLHDLRHMIADRLSDRAVSLAADALALAPRHETALRSALDHLNSAIELVAPHRTARALPDPELIAASLRLALDELAALAGNITPDEVLGRIFASFCIGK